MKHDVEQDAEERVKSLMCAIKQEPVPQKIVALAHQLQEALDARSGAPKKQTKPE